MADVFFVGAPKKCDVCQGDFGKVMIDGPSAGRGSPWGCMCWSCWTTRCNLARVDRNKFGTGLGQKYSSTDKGWKKVSE